jgi:CheY-like chemotaxis protein
MDAFDQQVFLLAEDNKHDAFFLQSAFDQAGVLNRLQVVRDGAEAIAYLQGEGCYSNREEYPLPIIVLLDLYLPRRNGFDVLEWMRQQPDYQRTAVVFLTVSNRCEDAHHAWDLGANLYLTKPCTFDELVELTRCLQHWVRLNHFSSPYHQLEYAV